MTKREELINDIIQQVRNGIQDTLLLHAPDEWQDEGCDAVEHQALDSTRRVLAQFNIMQLRSTRAVPTLQAIAASLRMNLIREEMSRRTGV